MKDSFYPQVLRSIEEASHLDIKNERKKALNALVDYIKLKRTEKQAANLNFICTHNSRRSQFSQIWAQVAGAYFDVPVHCFSGGVEVTAFNKRAVESLRRSGLKIEPTDGANPTYHLSFSDAAPPIIAFSKTFDDPQNNNGKFAAVMTCSHADDNCPVIPDAEMRIPLLYDDPKLYDDTSEEAYRYDQRSMQISSEMLYVFSKVRSNMATG